MKEQEIQELLQTLFKLKYDWKTDGGSYVSAVINKAGKQNVENIIRSFLLDTRDSARGQLEAKVMFYEDMIKKSTFAPFVETKSTDENDKCNLQSARISLLDSIISIVDGDGSSQERMEEIKTLLFNEA